MPKRKLFLGLSRKNNELVKTNAETHAFSTRSLPRVLCGTVVLLE